MPAGGDSSESGADKQLPARTPGGQFVKGQSGNPAGRPKGRKNEIVQLKQDIELAIRQHVHPEKLKKVVEKVLNKAMNGNMAAAKLIFEHFLTKASGNDEEGQTANTGWTVIVENATFKMQNKPDDPANQPAIEAHFEEQK